MELRDGDDCLKVIIETAAFPLKFGPDIEVVPVVPIAPNTSRPKTTNIDESNTVRVKKIIQCPLCNRKFRRRDHLSRHMKTVHAPANASTCPICSEDCKKPDSLTKHLRVSHPNESQYHCNECDYNTDNLKVLELHRERHELPNKFVCDICNAIFKRQDHVNRHKRSLHYKEVVPCGACNQTFKRKDHMIRHMREKHS